MNNCFIPYEKTGYFSSLILDYLDEKSSVVNLYHRFPAIENFEQQIAEKSTSFTPHYRNILVKQLRKQYKNTLASNLTESHINLLQQENCFTVTTGHQLNLFTGPLYFLYKIISTINLCKQLRESHPGYHFIPVYWMATEDHDFKEINHFNFREKKVVWEKKTSGAVGRISTEDIKDVYSIFASQLGESKNAHFLKSLFEKAYLKHKNLADATRFLVNELFGKYGLVIINADDSELKKCFIPYFKDEILNKTSYQSVTKSIKEFDKKYTVQVNPRKINLFYITSNIRERIVETEGVFQIKNTPITFSKEEILTEIEQHPEKFSPNVLVRPLYQEVILPNLCYIGGGGEMAYWLQLKAYFEEVKIPFPILLLRNSVLLVPQKTKAKIEKLVVSIADLFLSKEKLTTICTRRLSEIDINFSSLRKHLQQQFETLYKIAEHTDKSFLGAVSAQEKKQLNGLNKLEKRLLKAQKRKYANQLSRILEIQNNLFPNGNLQERTENFSQWYLEYGNQLIEQLLEALQPLNPEFTIIRLNH